MAAARHCPRPFLHRLKPEVLVLGRAHAQLRLRAKAIGLHQLDYSEVGPGTPHAPAYVPTSKECRVNTLSFKDINRFVECAAICDQQRKAGTSLRRVSRPWWRAYPRRSRQSAAHRRTAVDGPRSLLPRGARSASHPGTVSRPALPGGLLVSNDLLEPLLCEGSLQIDQAAGPSAWQSRSTPWWNSVWPGTLRKGDSRHAPAARRQRSRLLDILARVSDGNRILPSLARLLHSTDAGLRSKAALIMGAATAAPCGCKGA